MKITANPPALVLVEAAKLQYTRYHGALLTNQVKSDRLLDAAEVETLRVKPEELVGPEPQAA